MIQGEALLIKEQLAKPDLRVLMLQTDCWNLLRKLMKYAQVSDKAEKVKISHW